MNCLYCGKEIGASQFPRDDVFCCPAHRRSYGERLAQGHARTSRPALEEPEAPSVEMRDPPPSERRLPVPPAAPVMARVRQFAALEPRASAAKAPLRLPFLGGVELIADSRELPAADEAAAEEVYPVAGFFALEYFSQRVRGAPRSEVRRLPAPRLPVLLPTLRLEPLAAPQEDLAPPKPARKPAAKVIAIPAGARPMAPAGSWWHAARAIAAGVFIGLLLWGGASLLRLGLSPGQQKAGLFAPTVGLDASNSTAQSPSSSTVASARVQPAKGPVAWVRTTIAKRAMITFGDEFRRGMSAWGERAGAWAPGWSKNSAGYVRPGQLALFRPSLAYKNYHMEFLTQIENRSVGWVVRARDRKNYYGMKFKVVEPGLRPIIAVVHFTMLGGKAGREVVTPLSVMVHNNEPYHVAVEVAGNRVVTSIEGQEVDSFTDNTLTAGGVGFFADAGERSRLYWMQVTANDDFVGKVCAYVAGALGQKSPAAAELQPGQPPMGVPGPSHAPQEIALAAALRFGMNRKGAPWAC